MRLIIKRRYQLKISLAISACFHSRRALCTSDLACPYKLFTSATRRTSSAVRSRRGFEPSSQRFLRRSLSVFLSCRYVEFSFVHLWVLILIALHLSKSSLILTRSPIASLTTESGSMHSLRALRMILQCCKELRHEQTWALDSERPQMHKYLVYYSPRTIPPNEYHAPQVCGRLRMRGFHRVT